MPSYSASLAANLLCDLTCSRRFSRIKKCLGIHRQHSATCTGSLECAPLICGCECFPLCLGVIPFGVCLPPLCGFLPASAAHRGQCLTLGRCGLPSGPRRCIRGAAGLCDVSAYSAGHCLAVAHRRHFVVASVCSKALSGVVGVFVGVDDRSVGHALSCCA